MKILNFTDEEPVIVKGKPGVDKVPANVPEGSFVVPKENVPVAVKLTDGEMLIPPKVVKEVDAKAKQAGMNGINDLAPGGRHYVYPPGKDIPLSDKEGYTESQLRDRNQLIQAEQIAEKPTVKQMMDVPVFDSQGQPTGRTVRKLVEVPNPYYRRPGYVKGGLVERQAAKALGVSNEDIAAMAQQPVEPQADAQQKAEQDYINSIYQNISTVPEDYGNEVIRTNRDKIYDIIGRTTPAFDEKKAERLKRIAAVNSIGQGISAAFSGVMGKRGGPILNTNNDITPKALAEYQMMVAQDKDNRHKTALLQAQQTISSMREEAANTLANKKYNAEQIARANTLVHKYKLDKVLGDRKQAQALALQAVKFDNEKELAKIKNQADAEKAKTKFGYDKQLAYIHESGADRRAGSRNELNPPVTFSRNGVDDEISENDVIAIANRAIADKEAQKDRTGKTIMADELALDPEYQYMTRASQGGLNAKELKQFVQRYYPVYGAKAGVVSRNDRGKQPESVPEVKTGWESTLPQNNPAPQEPLKPNQNPSRQPVEPKKNASRKQNEDPFAKFGGKLEKKN